MQTNDMTTLERNFPKNGTNNKTAANNTSLGMNAVKDRMDNLIMDGLKKAKHLRYNSTDERYEENDPHTFGLARSALRVWVQNTPNQRVRMDGAFFFSIHYLYSQA